MTDKRRDIIGAGLLILLGFVLYVNTFSNGFVYDDEVTVRDNLFIRDFRNLGKIFSRDYYTLSEEYSFRPLVTLTYFLDYAGWRNNPGGFHLTNILLHVACGIVFFFISRRLFSDFLPAFLASLFFLVHPAQTEAVNAISFREDLLCAFFFFLSLLLYIRNERKKKIFLLLSVFCFILAILSKEMAVSLPLIILTYELIIRKAKWKNVFRLEVLLFFAVAFLYGLARVLLLYQQKSLPASPEFGNPLTRLSLIVKGIGLYGRLLFFPVNLTVEYADPFPPVAWGRYLIIPSFLMVGFYLAVLIKSRSSRTQRFGVAFLLLALLPVLNIIPGARLGAERFLYLPIFGFCLWAAGVVSQLTHSQAGYSPLNDQTVILSDQPVRRSSKSEGGRERRISTEPILKRKTAIYIPLVLVILLWGTGTIRQNRVWSNNLCLFSRAVDASPRSSKAHHGLGNEYFRRGRLQEAREELRKAIAIFPREPLYYNSLGVVYGEMGMFEEALNQFRASGSLNPGDPMVKMNMSTLHLRMGNFDQALAEIEDYIALLPFDPKGYLNRGEIYLTRGEYQQAIASYQEALRRDPYSVLALSSLGYCYYRREDYEKAKEYWEKALKLDPNNPELRHNLKIISPK